MDFTTRIEFLTNRGHLLFIFEVKGNATVQDALEQAKKENIDLTYADTYRAQTYQTAKVTPYQKTTNADFNLLK